MAIKLNEELYKEIQEFLSESSDRYSEEVQRAKRDLEFFSGDFWGKGQGLAIERGDSRPKMALSELPKFVGAIQSAAKKSPYHSELTMNNDADEEMKKILNGYQNIIDSSESKSHFKDNIGLATYLNIIMGISAINLTTVSIDGVSEFRIDSIRDISTVAFDPTCEEPDCSDAEEGALVTWMPKRKAKRLYGDIVCDITTDEMNFGSMWKSDSDNEKTIPVITYYRKVDGGVEVHKFVGKCEVDEVLVLPCKCIPLFRMTGYPVFRSDRFSYVGIVDKVRELQVGINLAYSSLAERMNRSIKAGYICEAEAIEGLQDQIGKLSSGDVPLFLYKRGFNPPQPIIEQFQVADLQTVITTSQNIMASIIGVPLQGVQGVDSVEKTATESLLQQENAESNVDIFYQALERVASRIGESMAQILYGNPSIPFSVKTVNGPSVVTTNNRRRIELMKVADIVPDNMKPLVAAEFSKTLDDEVGDRLADNIIANLDPAVKLMSVDDNPEMLHVQNQARQLIDSQSAAIDELNAKIVELTKENQTLSLSILDNREARQLDLAKTLLENERQAAKDRAEIALKSEEVAIKYEAETNKANIEAAKLVQDAVEENNRMVEQELGRVPVAIAQSPAGFDGVPEGSFTI